MAPLIRLFAFFALSLAVLASPHVSRHVHDHARRALAVHPPLHLDAREPVSVPRRKRSLNKRCIPRPSNSTTVAAPTSTPAPMNVAPEPSLPSSSASSPAPPSPAVDPTPSPSPIPSDTTAAAPTTYSPPPAPSSSSPAAQPSTTSSDSGSSSESYLNGVQSGQGTYYEPGLGACGETNTASDYIAAVSYLLFDSYPGYDGVNPNTNPVCNKQVTAYYQGKSVTMTITDRCTGCNTTDLDMSPTAFGNLADLSVGRIDITWKWA